MDISQLNSTFLVGYSNLSEKSNGVMENLHTFWKGRIIAFFFTSTLLIPKPVMARYELGSATWYHILNR
jgi:hypothetical protein